jgi:hypothetical protein
VYAALKADQDKTTQRFEMQPEEYTRELGMSAPLHVSAAWTSISELFAHIAEAALFPNTASPRTEAEPLDRTHFYIFGGVASMLFFITQDPSSVGISLLTILADSCNIIYIVYHVTKKMKHKSTWWISFLAVF